MRRTLITLICLCLVMSASLVMAKEKKPSKQMDQQAMMEEYKKLSTPGSPHKLYASLAGNWTTTTKEWMDPNKVPTESTGSVEMKMLLDGRFLQEEFTGNMMGQSYSAVGVHGYDNLRKKYVTTWIRYHGYGHFYDGRHSNRRWQDHHAQGTA